MIVSLGFWEWGCPKHRDTHITVTPDLRQSPRFFASVSTKYLHITSWTLEQANSNHLLVLSTLVHFVWKRIHFAALRPSIHTDILSVFTEKASIWKRSWKWIKTKTLTYRFLLYRYWWNTRIFPFTKKSYLHRAQWRYYFYLSRVRILVSSWLLTLILTFCNGKYKYYCLYFSFITLYPSFITFLWQAFCDRWPL